MNYWPCLERGELPLVFVDCQKRFIELFSRFTCIDQQRLADYLADGKHNVIDLLQRPHDIANNERELKAIEELRELRNMYDILKSYDRDFRIKSPQDAYNYFRAIHMDRQDKEYFTALFLNTKNIVIDVKITSGTINETKIYIREIAKDALFKNAAALIFCHNHPSGDPTPSQEDIRLTQRLNEVFRFFDIAVCDHLIVANESYVSLLERFGSNFGVMEEPAEYGIGEKIARAQEQSRAYSAAARSREEIAR